MNEPGIKLTAYFSERARSGGHFIADALLDVYEHHQIHTSVLLRGVEGTGQHRHLHTDRLLTPSESLPAVSIAVDTRERIEDALPEVTRVTPHGLITLERAQLITGDDAGRVELSQHEGTALKVTFYGGRSVRVQGMAGYVAAVDLLRRSGAAAASVLLAIDGTLHGERRRARFFARNSGVPLALMAVGSASHMWTAVSSVSRMLGGAVATVERVQVCKSHGVTLSAPHELPGEDGHGRPLWQKLTVTVEEQAKVGEHSVYRELVRRLRDAGAAGATALRGVRGFYGDHEPFADRVLSLRRNVPVHTTLLDTPGNIQRWWPIVDEVTREAGLVTSELVPALHEPVPSRQRRTARTHGAESFRFMTVA